MQSLMAAQGPVSSVQEALRREQLFSGETNGMLDETTRSALRNFQIRQGLPITGEIDAGTLQALEDAVKTPSAERPPIESVSRTGRTAEATPATAEKDRAFLQTLNQPEPNPAITAAPSPPVPAPEPKVTIAAPALSTPEPIAEAPLKPEPKPRKSPTEKQRPRSAPAAESQSTPPRVVRMPPGTVDRDAEPLDSHGTRVIHPPKLVPSPSPVAVRRAEPVNPPPRKEGFFHRLFKDDGPDDD